MRSGTTTRFGGNAVWKSVVTALLLMVSWAPVAIAQDNTQQPTTPPRRNPGRNIPTPPKPGATEPKDDKKSPVKPAPAPQPGQQPAKPTPQPSPQPPPPSEPEDGQPVGRDETGRVKIDPELQKKIDQMLQDKPGRNPNEPQGAPVPNPVQPPSAQPQPAPPNPGQSQPQPLTPAQRAAERRRATPRGADGTPANPPGTPGGQPVAGQPVLPPPEPMNVGGTPGEENGPSTTIEIAPEPDLNTIPPEQRQYGFSIKNGTYEQLIKGFAHQTGLGVLGEAPRDGTVTFETTETLGFREALSRIRMLLFNYKPHEPYWILYEGTHLRVIRVTDFYRILPLDRMFRSVEDFKAANLPDDEIVLVIYTPKSGSIADLRQVRDFLPDYVRVTPLETGNSVSIFALVSDIEKYLELIEFFPTGGDDPRTIERFEVQFISATEAVNRLRMLADLDGGGRAAVPTGGRRGASAQPNPLDQMSEPTISMIPDDGQGYILVRAMKDKIEEIRKLLPYVDVDVPASEFKPVVIPIEHAEAAELVTAIQQVLSASVAPVSPAGQPAASKSPRKGRRGAAGAGGGGPVAADSVTMIPHPSKNAIVVLGDEAGIVKVRDLVSLFDVSSVLGPIRIQLEVADASEVVNTVTQVLGVGGVKGQPGPGMSRFQLVPDPSGSAIWYIGSEQDLAKVREVVAALDVAVEPVSLRVVRLTYLLPSFVTGILREFDGSTAASPTPAPATRNPKTKRVTTQAVSKFTPDDGQKLLYILCSDADWHRYEALIAQIDQPVANEEPFVRLTVKHIDPGTALDRLGSILGSAGNVDPSIRMVATDDSILLIGATPTDVVKIKVFVAEIDKPSIIEQRTFEIHHADPADIKMAIETLLGGGSSEPRAGARRRIPRGEGVAKVPGAVAAVATDATVSEEMTVLQMGNRLVVKASPQRLDEVAGIIAEFDVETTGTEMKVYADFPPGSDIIGISETLISVFGGGPRPPRAVGKDGASAGPASSGPRFIPQPASGRLVVMAERTQFAEIEKLLSVLRVEASAEPLIVEFVEVKYGDPLEVVEDIRPLLDMKIRGLVESGELSEAPTEGTTPTTVPRLGRVKALQKSGGSERYHIAADARDERIVIAAPRAIVDEAKRLIDLFDQPARKKDKIVFRTVDLANASPAEMVKAVKEMMGRPSVRRPAVRGKPAVAGGAPGAAGPEGLSTDNLTIVEAPGGGAIVLNGAAAEVDQATEWIKQLDAMSTRGRSIRLYEVKGADIGQVFDLIVHVVDSSASAATGAGRPVRPPMPGKGAKEESKDEEEFTTIKTHVGADLYIQADLIGKTMLVATTPSKMAQIDDIVKRFETDKVLREGIEEKFVPKFVYELEHADASDARRDLEDLLESLWEPQGKLPKVEKLFKDSLVVRYPDESRFDEIKKLIRDHIDKPSDKKAKRVKKSFFPPPGMSAEEAAARLKIDHPDYTIELLDISSEEDEKTYDIEVLKPTGSAASVSPCVLPSGFAMEASAILAGAVGQTPPEEEQQQPQEEPAGEPIPEEPIMEQPVAPPANLGDTMIRNAVAPFLKEDAKKKPDDKEKSKERSDGRKPKEAKKLKVYYDKNKGVFVVEGEEEDIDEVKDWLDDLKDEIDKFPVKPDIRIVRVRYIDVYTAQDIIEEMFNATKSQQQMFNVQQQQQQQQQRLQQMQQQRLQQQPQQRGQQLGQDGKGGPGVPGQPGQQPQLPQPQMQMPQLPAPAVRVYPNPRDRSLILRAETSQYPQILELLATIDQPKPVDSVMRTFQLKKLNAVEVEQMLREALHLDDAKSRPKAVRAPTAPGMPGASQGPSTGPGGQLPHTVLQESTTGKLLGVDPQDITLFSSETANAIMVMAPPAALDYIGKLIEQFESGDMAERVTRYYEIKYASVADVAEQLTNYFNEKSPGGAGRGARKAASGSAPGVVAGGGGLNAPSFISYDRLNLLTVQATEDQFKEIEEVLARLDVKSDEDEWKDVVLAHADAKQVADTLTEMFSGGGGGSAMGGVPRGPAGGAASGASKGGGGAKFIGEAGGRIVLFSAPKTLHEQILANVAKLEEQSRQTTVPRIIELKNATPSQVADAIEKAYDTKRTGARGTGTNAPPRFTITAHDPSHRLFFVGDDEMFSQIQSLVATLDTPGSSGLSVEFRIYPLKYANAKAVHSQLTKLMTDYLQRLGADAKGKGIEAFSVQPDETANALIVLGSPSVFGFIEENLRKIDTPAAVVSQQAVHVVEVKNADPDALVKALSEIFVRTATKTQEGDVPISISAAAGSKAILVKCNAVDFAKIEATIKELDTQEVATAGDVRVVSLLYGDAAEVNTALQEYLKKPGGQGGRGGQLIGDVRLGVLGQTNAIMVSGDKDQLDRIEAIVHGMDIAGEKGSVPQIIPLKYASASMVLPALKEMFSDPKLGGGGKKSYAPPVIVADEMGNNVIVRGSPTDLAAIQGVIEKLDTADKAGKSAVRIVQIAPGINVEDLAEKVEQSINESAKLRAGGGAGRGSQTPSILAMPDKRTNSITVAGSTMLFDEAESMIKALEKMGPSGNQVTAIIPVTNIKTEDLQRLIDQMTTQQSGGAARHGSSGGAPRPPGRGSGRP